MMNTLRHVSTCSLVAYRSNKIPGIGVVGPIFNPRVVIGAEISAQLDFTYGFQLTVCFHLIPFQSAPLVVDVPGAGKVFIDLLIWVLPNLKVPNNSSIIIGVGAPTENSSIQGL